MEEKFYTFTRHIVVCEFGGVTASSEEEAIQKIKDGEYDDIIDSWTVSQVEGTIELKEE